MKKVLLVNTNVEKGPYPVPPLGLCLLASSLKDRFDVKVYDGVFDEGKGLVPLVKDYLPDYIGFSIRNVDDIDMDRAIYYIDRILSDFIFPVREISGAPIILGGSGFSIFPDEILKLSNADYGVIGEGEEVFRELLICLSETGDASGIPNVITQKDHYRSHRFELRSTQPSNKPFSEIDRWIDFLPYRLKGPYSIQTKRGCAHGCIYCTYPLIEGDRFRIRPPSEVVDEMEQAADRLGDITFEFVDSTFNDPEGHAEAICREIISRGRKFRMRTMGINPSNTSERLFSLMMEAGFVQIDATPDSASPRMIRNLRKGFRLEEVQKMAELIRKYDLPTMWFFLLGGPGEDESTVAETFDFIDRYVNPDDMVFLTAGIRIYPGTPMHEIALKEGYIEKSQNLLHPSSFFFSPLLGKECLHELLRQAIHTRPNCLLSGQTTPSPEMMKTALDLRKEKGIREPMFRTLLRIRKQWINEGKLKI